MSRNHRNRSWRAQWTYDQTTGVATHRSGVTARQVGAVVLVDTDDYRGTRECSEEIFTLQAQRLFEDLEPEPHPAPRM